MGRQGQDHGKGWEAVGRQCKAVEKTRRDQEEIVVGSGGQQERQWEAARGGHARAPDPSPRHPSSPTALRSLSLAQPDAGSWCRPPGCPHPAAVTDSQQVARATTATSSTSSSRSRPAASSALRTRHRRVQRPAREEHPQASSRGLPPPPCGPPPPPCAGRPRGSGCCRIPTWAGLCCHRPQRHVLVGTVIVIGDGG